MRFSSMEWCGKLAWVCDPEAGDEQARLDIHAQLDAMLADQDPERPIGFVVVDVPREASA